MRIGVLTGGGDAPGLNAAIRAVARRAFQYGDRVFGISNGWLGLLKDDVQELTPASVSGILHVGGTILGASRTNPFARPDGPQTVLRVIKEHALDAVVVIGGIDTLNVAHQMSAEHGVPLIAIPKTIDNNISGTDQTIGFDSAVAVVAESLDKLHTTASAHSRVMVVEVMGREAGWVAMVGGLAGGADYILIPEVESTVAQVTDHLKRRASAGKPYSVVVVAEGAYLSDLEEEAAIGPQDEFGHMRMDRRGIGEHLARAIEKASGFEARFVVLGYIQRGGSPTVSDRVLATRMGVLAVDMAREGRFGEMASLQGNRVEPVPLSLVTQGVRQADVSLYELAQIFM